jgi:hypothetical protein
MKITKKLIRRIEESFNMIVEDFGESKYYMDIPYLDIMKRTDIMEFSEDFADGKVRKKDLELIQGWFDPNENSIVLILENIDSIKDVIKTILHEYQHYLQCPAWIQRYYNMGYTYDNHPYEVQATNSEQLWLRYFKQIKYGRIQ